MTHEPAISRRQLLTAGTGALALALAACSSNSNNKKTPMSPMTSSAKNSAKDAKEGTLTLGQIFDARVPAATPLRLPLGLLDHEGVFAKNPPATISARVGPKDGDLGSPVEIARHDNGLERAYYPLFTTLATAGTWRLVVNANDQELETTLSSLESAELPGRVVQPGEKLPSIATPTSAAPLGVNPVCTAKPPCPLHEVSLDQALKTGNPIALMVSTPAFCQTAICGPVLDLFLDQRETFSQSITMIHLEVYTDDTAKKTTDVVEALGLTYEPSLFLAAPDGTLSERLDYIFDVTELGESLSRLTV